MEPIGAEVDLIVKAANQQTPDVKIQVQSAWSVRDLKLHLAENYPNKPSFDEQKIIYSGRLLPDSTVLKDVLRQYEGQQAHTLHLVCARQRLLYNTNQPNRSSEATEGGEGLRRRNVNEAADPGQAPRPEMRQNDQNHNFEMQNYYTHMMSQYNGLPPAPAFHPPGSHYHQMIMMQQAYAQYMHQYANMWQAAAAGNINAAQPVNAPNEQEPQRAAAAPDAGEDEAEGGAPRDWLDWLYAMSRLAILLTLLYLYTTPLRLTVIALVVAIYFMQLVVLREGQPQNQQNPAQRPQAEPPRPAADIPETIDNNSQPQNPEAQPSTLGATWMIVTSFFTSLIPEAPNVV